MLNFGGVTSTMEAAFQVEHDLGRCLEIFDKNTQIKIMGNANGRIYHPEKVEWNP